MTCAVTAPEVICKQPSEDRQYAMDFTNVLATDEVIASVTSLSVTLRGGGVSDLTVYNEVKSSDSLSVLFWAKEGTNNTTHRIEIVVLTSTGQTIEGDGLLSVRDK
jgi:hypothetical protein